MRSLVPMIPALTSEERIAHMEVCAKQGFPLLKRETPKGTFKPDVLTLACYGPSLAHTWTHVRRPLMTTSGAHDFLIGGGIVPDFHVECDPREEKTFATRNAHKDVRYLMASCSHPKAWDNLRGHNVSVWHVHNDPFVEHWAEERGEHESIIAGGSNAGLRALEVAAALGYRRFAIHGMDCSYADVTGKRHADAHPHEYENQIVCTVGGKEYMTSAMLYEAAREFLELFCVVRADIEVVLFGDGLLQTMVREAKALKTNAIKHRTGTYQRRAA